jgi:hypothetical protein
MNEVQRNLTNGDVIALANEIEKRMVDRFYNDLGRGVWGVTWRVLMMTVLAIAAYGSIKGIK